MSIRPGDMGLPDVCRELNTMQNRLEQSVKRKRFTPFLGAGASSLRRGEQGRGNQEHAADAWGPALSRVAALRTSLASSEEQEYLTSVARAHRIHLGEAAGDERLSSVGSTDEHLFALQLSLASLGSRLARVFGLAMARGNQCVSDVVDCGLTVEDSEAREGLVSVLDDAICAARGLARPSQGTTDAILEADVIYEKLVILRCRICASDGCECFEGRDGCAADYPEIMELRDMNVDLRGRSIMRLDELSWVGDLLWHTLRYRVPAYPTTTELTFQLSLMTGLPHELRKGRLAQVAELQANYEDQLRRLHEWFSFCESDGRASDLHLGIAAALLLQFQDSSSPVLPMALTTNYDRALEMAFEQLETPYHIVFPVYVGWGTSALSIAWVFKTVGPGTGRPHPPPVVQDCTTWKSFRESSTRLQGPVVVKLHGSPLDRVPSLAELGIPGHGNLEHFIVLTESSYLASIVGRRSYPLCIEQELKESRRMLWFLGYSIGDWNVRLRLYEHLYRTEDSLDPSEKIPVRLDVDLDFDPIQSAVLGFLQINVYIWDLLALATALRRIPEIRSILRQRGYPRSRNRRVRVAS